MKKYLLPVVLIQMILGMHLLNLSACPAAPVLSDSTSIWDSLAKKNKMTNNSLAIYYARKSLNYAINRSEDLKLGGAYMLMGEVYFSNQKDSSFIYYSKAIKVNRKHFNEKQRLNILFSLALLYQSALDTKNAIIYLDSAINLAKKTKNYSALAEGYNVLGNLKRSMQNKEEALVMFDSSFKIAKKYWLYKQMGVALGNIANFDRNIKKYREAFSYLKKSNGTEEEQGGLLINIGLLYENPDSALKYLKKALNIGIKNKLIDLQIGAYNNMAYYFLDKKDLKGSETSINLAIGIAQTANNNDWLSTLYDTYADILTSKADYKSANEYQKKALSERKIFERKQAAGQSRLLAALLDTKNKELLIQSKENEILIQSNRLQKTRLGLVITVILIIAVSFIFYWYQQRTRMKLKIQQVDSAKRIIELEESEKGRIARELHDITGQLVMGITSEIENLDIPSNEMKDEIQEKIKSLGKSIRNISHRMNRSMMEHFSFEEMMTGQCEDVQRLTGIPIFLNLPGEKLELTKESILHIYRIFQELLTNASKYVKEGEVFVDISKEGSVLKIIYSDTGPGFDTENVKMKGMGLINILERSKLMGGYALIDSSPGNGTSWEIVLPIFS